MINEKDVDGLLEWIHYMHIVSDAIQGVAFAAITRRI